MSKLIVYSARFSQEDDLKLRQLAKAEDRKMSDMVRVLVRREYQRVIGNCPVATGQGSANQEHIAYLTGVGKEA